MRPPTNFGERNKFIIILVLLGIISLTPALASAATFHVTTTADNGNNQIPTPGSLREAILKANATQGTDTIDFQTGTGLQTIAPPAPLPAITEAVIIDGTTQQPYSGTPLIELSGANAGASAIGLQLLGGDSVVKGLIVNSFTSTGIYIKSKGNNLIIGNFISLDATGKVPFINKGSGIVIDKSSNNVIGGTTPLARNVVAADKNTGGIFIYTNGQGTATGNVIQGNYIGTDVTGTASVGTIGNAGVYVQGPGADNNLIGGTAPGAGNLISANRTGVELYGFGPGKGPANNKIQGNFIGTKADGKSPLGNTFNGIFIFAGHDNQIGGAGAGEGNVIAFNGTGYGDGGIVMYAQSLKNSILGNSIYANKGLGIDLATSGVTINDAGDTDTGITTANENQNYPEIVTVKQSGTDTLVKGTLNSLASTQFRIEFYASDIVNPSGLGEGQRYLGFTPVTTDASGNANFSVTFPTASVNGPFITATATDPSGNTSEFSGAMTASGGAGLISVNPQFPNVGEGSANAVFTITRTGGSTGVATVDYSTKDGDPFNIDPAAIAGTDYKAVSGTVTFADGETVKSVSVPLIDDIVVESDYEAFTFTLSNAQGGAVIGANNFGACYIRENDKPFMYISDVSVLEGSNGTTNAVFTVGMTQASPYDVTVTYATADGTAKSGSDYQAASGTLTLNAGETTKTISVPVNSDTTQETNESFFVKLSKAVNATIGTTQATGTIIDDDTPGNATIQLSQSASSVIEADSSGVATITVNRTGDTSAAATVDYSTSDNSGMTPCQTTGTGNASERCDYATTAGTLRFAAGEKIKSISIPVINDAYVEADETFTITLSNAQGGALGNTSSATVTVISEDKQTATENPIDDQAFFIKQQYVDFLGRVAEPAGFQFWMDRMNNCPQGQVCDRIDTSLRFFQSEEFQQRGFYVYRLYDAVLGRLPKYAEFVPDVARLNGFQTAQEQQQNRDAYLKEFVNRQEFKALYGQYLTGDLTGATDAAGFVNALSQKAGITPANAQSLIDNLQAKTKDPAHTVEDFILSQELSGVSTKFYDRGFITMQYFGYLRRDPEPAGFQFWQQKMTDSNHDYRFMVGGFIGSDEYRFRLAQISAP